MPNIVFCFKWLIYMEIIIFSEVSNEVDVKKFDTYSGVRRM